MGWNIFPGTANRFKLGTHPFYYNGSKPIAIIFNDSTNEVLYQTIALIWNAILIMFLILEDLTIHL